MREILFRGKSLDSGGWVEGGYLKRHNAGGEEKHMIFQETQRGFSYTQVIPGTVCQYTGVTDKNGMKVFEHDILHEHGNRLHLFYYPTFAMYMMQRLPKGGGTNGVVTQIYNCEVIGNVFDNPELLEGGVTDENSSM